MKKEKFIQRFFVSRFFLLISIVILGLLFFSLGKKLITGRQIDKEINAMEEEAARLETKSSELEGFLNYLNTDTFLEQEARLKFNLQKPGESVMVVPQVGLKKENKEDVSLAQGGENMRGNPAKWWNYFFW